MTTQDDIRRWLQHGKTNDDSHIIVVCDTFDYEDYPVYVKKTEDVTEIMKRFNGNNMQKIMEVYDLSKDIEPQLNEHRAYNL